MSPTYTIVRYYLRKPRRTLKRDLTLEQAQEHCANPETSSHTCCSTKSRTITQRNGPWFDGYKRENTLTGKRSGSLSPSMPVKRGHDDADHTDNS